MKIHQIFSKIERLLVNLGKVEEITVRAGDFRIPINNVVWCDGCNEFHIDIDVEIINLSDIKAILDDIEDKAYKSWLN